METRRLTFSQRRALEDFKRASIERHEKRFVVINSIVVIKSVNIRASNFFPADVEIVVGFDGNDDALTRTRTRAMISKRGVINVTR